MSAPVGSGSQGDDSTFKPDPPKKVAFYQVVILFAYHVALAMLMAYLIYNIWPPQPWPGDRAKAIANANQTNTNAGGRTKQASTAEANTNVASAPESNTNDRGSAAGRLPAGSNANSGLQSNINAGAVANTNASPATNANANANSNVGGAANTNSNIRTNPGSNDEEAAMSSYGGDYPPPFWLFGYMFRPPLETRLILLVLLAGAIGSFVHAASSFVDYLGNRTFISSWVWWYLMRPFIGMMLALIFYFVFRGGFITAGVNQAGDAAASFINPFGVAAVAGLVGMFSKVAADKLNEVFETLFSSSQGDANRGDKLNANLTPAISTIGPKSGPLAGGTPVTINGTGFMEGAQVSFGGVAATAVVVNNHTTLTAITPAHAAAVVDVEVTNPNKAKGVLKGGFTYQ